MGIDDAVVDNVEVGVLNLEILRSLLHKFCIILLQILINIVISRLLSEQLAHAGLRECVGMFPVVFGIMKHFHIAVLACLAVLVGYRVLLLINSLLDLATRFLVIKARSLAI